DSGFKTTDSNTTYQLTKTGSTIKLTGSDGSETSVTDSDTNTTYGVATISASGLMSAADKTKLNGIATGANKTTVDTALSSTSTNPVQNKVVQTALNNKADADILGTFVSSGFAGIGEVTDQLLDCRRSATIVVGASDSKYYSDYSYSANYKCTGTADQGQINSAIAALPSNGGKIVLLEGTYNISGSINVNKPNVTIEGMGNGTVLKTSSNISAINVSSSNCEIRYLSLICTASDRYGNGIYVTGSSSIIENIRITHFEHNIYLAPGSDYAIVTKCYLYDGEGICARSKYCIISDNSIENYDWAGIYLYGSSYCNVTGNILKDTGFGIFSQNAETQYNKVSNNYILRGTGTSDDYPSGKYSIYITAGTYNYFSDNYIPGKNYVNNAGSTNTFTNNRYS
ncbi:MAG: right-handed parallel beta-helix repeat-containing protein, partial [Clostridia bacterium]|nr:right-handed parallel beta-helix repeat-containing protein [Clostridia bacterium]